MGTWGKGSFENDDAMDWVYALEDSSDNSVIIEALDNTIDNKENYLEAPDCSVSLAAAEVVAALKGKPAALLPKEVNSWIIKKPAPEESLINKAIKAVDIVILNSELKDLWSESDEFSQWKNCLDNLKSRLKV